MDIEEAFKKFMETTVRPREPRSAPVTPPRVSDDVLLVRALLTATWVVSLTVAAASAFNEACDAYEVEKLAAAGATPAEIACVLGRLADDVCGRLLGEKK